METQKTHPTTPEQPPISPALQKTIERMSALNYPEYLSGEESARYFPEDTDASPVTLSQSPEGFMWPTARDAEADDEMAFELKSFDDELAHCRALVDTVCDGPLKACNPKVASCLKAALLGEVLPTLAAAHEHQKEAGDLDTPSFISLQALRTTLAGTAVMLGARDHQEVLTDSGVLVKPWLEAHSTRRDGAVRQQYAVELEGINDFADQDKYDDLSIPSYFSLSVAPDERVNFEVSFVPPHLREEFTSKVRQRGEFEQTTFSMRVDRDPKSSSGYSVDFGRDERVGEAYWRTADAAGKSAQLMRPEIEAGAHFTDAFATVSDEDFKEFTTNLGSLLRASIDMARYDQHLKSVQALGDSAYRSAA